MASKCNLYHTIIQQYMHYILRFTRSFAEIILKILDHLSDSLTAKIPRAVWGFAFSKFPHAFIFTIDSIPAIGKGDKNPLEL